jgi:fucose permease
LIAPSPAGQRGRAAIAFSTFGVIGLLDGAIGVAWPSMRAELHQPVSALGLLLILSTGGFLVSSAGIGRLLGRTGLRLGLSGGLVVCGVAMALIGLGSWPMALLAMVVYGLAIGVVDGGVNVYSTLRMSGGAMQFLHGTWSVGTLVGPLLVTFLLFEHLSWRLAFLLVGGLEAAIAVILLLGVHWPELPPPVDVNEPSPHLSLALLLGMLAFFLYTGVETAAGGWSYTLLTEGRRFAAPEAGLAVSAYWGGLAAGRMAAGVAGIRVRPRTLMLGGVLLTLGAALLFWWAPSPPWSAIALPLLGLGLAPIYPALMTLTSERLPAARVTAAVGYQTAAAGLGASAVPAGAGILMQAFGLAILGPFLGIGAAALAAAYWFETSTLKRR